MNNTYELEQPDLDKISKEHHYPTKTGFVPEQIMKQRSKQLKEERPEFFWGELVPAIKAYTETGEMPFAPPICGAMLQLGLLSSMDACWNFLEYWNS
jgi:hypothetical protein